MNTSDLEQEEQGCLIPTAEHNYCPFPSCKQSADVHCGHTTRFLITERQLPTPRDRAEWKKGTQRQEKERDRVRSRSVHHSIIRQECKPGIWEVPRYQVGSMSASIRGYSLAGAASCVWAGY